MEALEQDQQMALRVIESIDQLLEAKGNGTAAVWRGELALISKSIEENSGPGSLQGHRLLSEFLLANPELLPVVRRDALTQVLDFIKGVCTHYEAVKGQRPLTEAEKQLGKRLLDLLDECAR